MRRLSGDELRRELGRIDGRGYKAYKEIKGQYDLGDALTLIIDHVQGDPFAAPSRVRVRVSMERATFPPETWQHPSRAVALRSFLAERFAAEARRKESRRGSGKSGAIAIRAPGQQVLERNAVLVDAERVEARFTVGLPAAGRRVLGRQAAELLLSDVPAIAAAALLYPSLEPDEVQRRVEVNQDADVLRALLPGMGLVAFVADGAVLPRRSGVDDRPLTGEGVVPFRAPEPLRVSIELPNTGRVTGMGLRRGITLIVGGGFHGKSSLLNALERGVYNHKPGDGRELVITDPTAVKIRAEDGRSVAGVDISPFIAGLPYGRDTSCFCTPNASGSTSQAANILEALEAGCRLVLIDEDTAATNFMIRDRRMQALVAKDQEPITPFLDRARQLFEGQGVSTVLVIGGSGDYFDVADTVIAMDSYVPREVTAEARAIAEQHATGRLSEGGDASFEAVSPRAPEPASLNPRKGKREVSVKTRDLKTVQFGTEEIDLSAVEQLVDAGQTRALADALVFARERYIDRERSVAEILDQVMQDVRDSGLDVLSRRVAGEYAAFRRFELAAALNRLRTLEVRQR